MITNTVAAVRPTTFPARPINGGPLELALPKPGTPQLPDRLLRLGAGVKNTCRGV